MITPSFDAEYFNAIANDPKVKPWISEPGQGYLDVRPMFDAGQALGLKTDHGGFVMIKCWAYPPTGIAWEPHAFFCPQQDRLNAAVQDGEEMLYYAFCGPLNATFMEVWIPICSSLRGTGALLKATGFSQDGGDKFRDYYLLTKRQYLARHGLRE